jgi:hypothetical protein
MEKDKASLWPKPIVTKLQPALVTLLIVHTIRDLPSFKILDYSCSITQALE